MQYPIISFPEYTPDQPDFNIADGGARTVTGIDAGISGRGAMTAKNVIPYVGSYKPVAAPVALTTALTARPRGSFAAKAQDGNVHNFAGDVNDLYALSGAITFASVGAAGGYTLGTDDHWEFALWGGSTDLVIATSFTDNVQAMALGVPPFADLLGSPPRARHIAIARDFVVLGNVFDSVDGTVPNRVWWSAIDDPEDWTVSASTQCGYQSLAGDGGWIQKIVGGEWATIFQENAIWRMSYVGTPFIWRFDAIKTNMGTPAANSVIKVGDIIYFYSTEGFQSLMPDGSIVPIGIGKVDQTFKDDLDDPYNYRVSATVDRKNNLILWAYPGAGSSGGTPNKIIVYNYAVGKWSIIETDIEWLGDFRTTTTTLEGLDSINTSLDALSSSLDSKAYMGGALILAAFGTDNKLYTFTGTAMTATLETDEQSYMYPNRSVVNEVWPLVEGATTITTTIGTRATLNDSVTWGSPVSLDTLGKSNIRSDSRFHRHRVTITGGFNHATGVKIGINPGGLR